MLHKHCSLCRDKRNKTHSPCRVHQTVEITLRDLYSKLLEAETRCPASLWQHKVQIETVEKLPQKDSDEFISTAKNTEWENWIQMFSFLVFMLLMETFNW